MQTGNLSQEIGCVLLAFMLPAAIVVLIVLFHRYGKSVRYEARFGIQTSSGLESVFKPKYDGTPSVEFKMVLVDMYMVLLINVALATYPYGHIRGWW